jgi:ferredoxin
MRVLQCGPMAPPMKEGPPAKTPCMELAGGVTGGLQESACIACGQCTVFCPTGAIRERDATPQVMQALSRTDCTVVLQVAPSVRITLAEAFGGTPGQVSAEQLAAAARRAGFHAVFDTNLTADLTVMEEAAELLHRITEPSDERPLPMFTSCCPGMNDGVVVVCSLSTGITPSQRGSTWWRSITPTCCLICHLVGLRAP